MKYIRRFLFNNSIPYRLRHGGSLYPIYSEDDFEAIAMFCDRWLSQGNVKLNKQKAKVFKETIKLWEERNLDLLREHVNNNIGWYM